MDCLSAEQSKVPRSSLVGLPESSPMHTELAPDDYAQLVRDGHYASRDELPPGRLDHVRRIWENQLTRFYL